jgi:hypothetical protein
MRNRSAIQAPRPEPAVSSSPPATQSQDDECHGHDGHLADDCDSDLDAYVARLVDQAPRLSSEQRDTLALILRRPSRR